MIQVLCLQKFRNKNNQIIGYRIQDKNGNTLDVKSEYLKQAIRNNQIDVLNLTLTSDNKLIDKEYKPQKPQKPQKNNLKDIIVKIRALGTPFISSCGHTYYVIKNSDTTIVCIPDDVKCLVAMIGNCTRAEFCDIVCNTLKVIGGSGLESTYHMFWNCQAKSIDLSSFDASNVKGMAAMFEGCDARSIDLSSFDTSNVEDMRHMFEWCRAKSLDLRSFNTSKVTSMWGMFENCTAKSLDLSSFDTSKVTNMQEMFYWCHADSLDLSSFDTSNVINMDKMFEHCILASYIDLSSFNVSKVRTWNRIFKDCIARIKIADKRLFKRAMQYVGYAGLDGVDEVH